MNDLDKTDLKVSELEEEIEDNAYAIHELTKRVEETDTWVTNNSAKIETVASEVLVMKEHVVDLEKQVDVLTKMVMAISKENDAQGESIRILTEIAKTLKGLTV